MSSRIDRALFVTKTRGLSNSSKSSRACARPPTLKFPHFEIHRRHRRQQCRELRALANNASRTPFVPEFIHRVFHLFRRGISFFLHPNCQLVSHNAAAHCAVCSVPEVNSKGHCALPRCLHAAPILSQYRGRACIMPRLSRIIAARFIREE